jgi:hypothetical protein
VLNIVWRANGQIIMFSDLECGTSHDAFESPSRNGHTRTGRHLFGGLCNLP